MLLFPYNLPVQDGYAHQYKCKGIHYPEIRAEPVQAVRKKIFPEPGAGYDNKGDCPPIAEPVKKPPAVKLPNE
jgi:hypothetical protein